MPQQPAQSPLAFDRLVTSAWHLLNAYWRPRRGLGERSVAKALMRSMRVVELGVGLGDVIEMPTTETSDVIQAFTPNGGHPGLGKRIGLRHQPGNFDDRHFRILEEPIKGTRILGVSIAKKEYGL